jgi:hypothetical protein
MFEQQMQTQLFNQQRQGQQDLISTGMRLQGAGLAQARFGAQERERALKTQRDAEQAAADKREATNIRGAQDIFATGVQQGASREDLTRAAIDGKVPVSLMPKEPPAPKPTLEEKVREAEALTEARERTKSRFKTPKATKTKVDDPQLPKGFRDAISGRIGSTGFATREEALASIKANWPKWRANYPALDASKVKSELDNIYGPSESAGGRMMLSTPADMERRKANVTAKIDGLQKY